MTEKDWCIIPARGGSKRIPFKNIIEFNGKPLIAWTIDFALKIGCFERIIVSTDCKEIKKVAEKAGAEVPFLRDFATDDYTPVSIATIQTVEKLTFIEGVEPEFITQMMPNCPIRSVSTVNALIKSQKLYKDVSYISASNYAWFNPFWAHKVSTGNRLFSEYHEKRSQDLPDVMVPTGTIWRSSWKLLMKAKTFYSPSYKLFRVNYEEATDIDDPSDLRFAKLIHRGICNDKS